jgi:threonine dehydratase
MSADAPSLQAIRSLRVSLGDAVYRTPVTRCAALEPGAGGPSTIWGKLEFLQVTGTFKARGALSNLKTLDSGQLAAGVTAVSAGNHAIATAYAARAVGTTAKVIMLGSANPCRIELCKAYGAEVLVVDDVHEAFDVAEQVEREEGRFFVHPFEGPAVAAGTGMIGLEICEQVEAFDALIVPIGGGGLMGGISNAVKQLGEPRSIDKVRTIADSLGAPYALPYSFELCRRNVDRLVEVDDTQLRMAMGVLFRKMKIAVEPACAATTAAMLGPLHGDLRDKRVVLVFCGSNIDWETYSREVLFDE